MTHSRRRHAVSSFRSGWTLIELMVAISVLGVVMTLSGTLIVTMSRTERNAVRSCAAQQTLARLNEQFRSDIHRSDAAELVSDADGPMTLHLTFDGQTAVRYQIRQQELLRTAASADGEHREVFRIAHAQWSFEKVAEPTEKVRLTLHRPANTTLQTTKEFLPSVEWRLEAVLGLQSAATLPKGGV